MAGLVLVETRMGKYGEDMDRTGGEVDRRMLGRTAVRQVKSKQERRETFAC